MIPADYERNSPEVVIVGPNTMQNELMISFLEADIGLDCGYCSPEQLGEILSSESEHMRLFLLDSQSTDMFIQLSYLDERPCPGNSTNLLAAFNIGPDRKIENDALHSGLHGVFYRNEPLTDVTKGIRSILNGQHWYSRGVTSNHSLDQGASIELKGELPKELTPREKEVLWEIHSGISNNEIAANLSISFHTVKSHISNIFRKINVKNRFQAMLWTARNLDH